MGSSRLRGTRWTLSEFSLGQADTLDARRCAHGHAKHLVAFGGIAQVGVSFEKWSLQHDPDFSIEKSLFHSFF